MHIYAQHFCNKDQFINKLTKINTMKTIKYIIILSCLLITFPAAGQKATNKVQTIEFKAYGLCGMCKERIENAALIKGVKFTEWNKQTDMLKVVYNPQKVKLEDIHAAVAAVGHDTDLVKADDNVYKKLPKCCAYRDSNNKH
jgi:hypothetical protein